MAKRKALTENEVKSHVDSEIRSAMGQNTGELAGERAEAMDYYLGEASGDLAQENEDRSRVVITTVRDTVEWIMPQMMRIFAQADSVVEFIAVSEEDEPAAEQETQAINHIFWRQNEGFLILYTWIKDALLQKNGVVKFWVEDTEKVEKEEYKGLSEKGLMQLMEDGELTPIAWQESEKSGENGEQLVDVEFERKTSGCDIIIEPIPPEHFLITSDARSVDIQKDAPRLVGHYYSKTPSQLKEMGFSDAEIEEMRCGDEQWDEYDEEWQARYNLSDEQEDRWTSEGDESTREISLVEAYMELDIDGDGYSELVKIYRSGSFVDWEECDCRPFAAITPNILTHKFFGLSIADLVGDLQKIATAVMRNSLDNMFQVNNARPIVNDRVDVESLATSRSGAPVYVDDELPVDGAVSYYAPPPAWKDGLGFMEYLDEVRKDRTGVGDETMGLDPKTLGNANTGVVLAAIDAARGKIELIARIFAETGFKWLFRGIHRLMRKNYDGGLRFKLTNEYIEVNPAEWRDRTNLVVNVGTATGTRQYQQAGLAQVQMLQEKMVAGGLMGTTILPTHVYQMSMDTAEAWGQNGEKYFFNPVLKMQPEVQKAIQMIMPQKGPDPQMASIKAMAQAEQQKAMVSLKNKQIDAQIKGYELQLKKVELEGNQQLQALKTAHQKELSDAKGAADKDKNLLEVRKQNLESEYRKKEQEINSAKPLLTAEIDAYKAQLQSATQVATQAEDQGHAQYEAMMKAIADQTGKMMQTFESRLGSYGEQIRGFEERLSQPVSVEYDEDGRIVQIVRQ